MECQCEDFELRIRMNLLKCEKYKTFQEDTPNKKYIYLKECDSLHGLNILTDDSTHLNKASEANFLVPTKENKNVVKEDYDKKYIEEAADKEDIAEESPNEKATEKKEIAEESAHEEAVEKEEITEESSHEEIAAKDEDIAEEVTEEERLEQNVAAEEVAREKGPDEELEEEEIPEVRKTKTGVFRDYKRRIDIVLVVEDNLSIKTDYLKFDFLTNILRTGLEMEIEQGQMGIHKHLCFIKLHAPDSVLNEYGNMFAVKRYFVNNRMISNNFHSKTHEKEWLKRMRRNYTTPDGYSNYERSLIVYKILRHLPFGSHASQYGLHRLLKRNIILDAYALHDGPFFYLSGTSDRGTNGRQVLYYNWAGLENVFQSQPLNVIHEYFGPKIAFYYAFYGFYNSALTLASTAGIVSVLMPYIANKEPNEMKQLCKEDREMCPECYTKRCEKRPLNEYCTPIVMNIHLDHPYVLYFSMFMVFWAVAFATIWRQKEYILNWTWEVGGWDSYYETSKRPEFNVDYTNRRKSDKTGLKYDESGIYKVIRFSFSIILIPLCLVGSIVIMQLCSAMYDRFADLFVTKEKTTKIREYLILATFQTFYTLSVSALETVFHYLFYYLVDFENHKSHKAYESSLIAKQFAFSITLIYPFLCFYAWLVGNIQVYLGSCVWPERMALADLFYNIYEWLGNITPFYYFVNILYATHYYEIRSASCYYYCWPFTCINEVSLLLIVMLFFKQVVLRIVFNTHRLMTDYNEDGVLTENISCWEREYQLNVFSEAQLTRKYMTLAVQFSLITFFIIAFPLAPVVVLVVNTWDIRHSARKLLLASRRPLLIRSPGIGAWSDVILFTAYAAIAINVLTLVTATRQNLREYFQKPLNSTLILDFLLHKTEVQYRPGTKPSDVECYAPWLLVKPRELEISYEFTGIKSVPKNEWYLIQILSFKMIVVLALIMLSVLFVLRYLYKPYIIEIEKARAMENKIKNIYSHYKIISLRK